MDSPKARSKDQDLKPNELSDKALYWKVAHGGADPALWDAFIKRFSRLCYHAIHRTLAHLHPSVKVDADELFQEFFVYLLERNRHVMRLYRGERGCSPGTYLSHLAAWQVLEKARKIKRLNRREALLYRRMNEAVQRHWDEYKMEHLLDTKEDAEFLRNALEHLSDADRLLFRLHYEKGLKFVEIAKMNQRSESAVHVHHHRLKERLRKRIALEKKRAGQLG